MLASQRGSLQIDTRLHRIQRLLQTLGERLPTSALDVILPKSVHLHILAPTQMRGGRLTRLPGPAGAATRRCDP